MSKRPRHSAGYKRALRADRREWINSQYTEEAKRKAEAIRKEREDELAAVLADLPNNKPA